MTRADGYYSLVQYCPDPARAEVANVGVLLFCADQDFLDVRFSGSNARLDRFFGEDSFDPAAVDAAKAALRERLRADRGRLRTFEGLRSFARRRANDLLVTDPRLIRVSDPPADLDRLFDELVSEREHATEEGKRARRSLVG